MLSDTQQFDRRNAIVRLLRNGLVHKQGDLVHMLQRDGFAVTQSSISRDLRDLGVLKAGGRYVMPPDEITRANGDFGTLAQFVRQILPAGPCLTVVKTTSGRQPALRWPSTRLNGRRSSAPSPATTPSSLPPTVSPPRASSSHAFDRTSESDYHVQN